MLLALGLGGLWLILHSERPPLKIPDEKAVAAALLDQKLSGPRYFHSDLKASGSTQIAARDQNELRISVAGAKVQAAKIAKERQLNPELAAKLEDLIDQLAEPSASRMIGEATINVLRLNLALDELR